LSATQVALLAAFADGQERGAWDFRAGTMGWAKKAGYVALTSSSPRRYRITEAGLRAYRQVRP
jgi:hypothetical protein